MRDRNSDRRHSGKPRSGKPQLGKPHSARPEHREERQPSGKPPHGKPFHGKRAGKPKAAPWRSGPRDRDGPVVLYGWHTVKAALENPRRHFRRLLATENAARRLGEDNVAFAIEPELVRPDDIAAIAGPEAV